MGKILNQNSEKKTLKHYMGIYYGAVTEFDYLLIAKTVWKMRNSMKFQNVIFKLGNSLCF